MSGERVQFADLADLVPEGAIPVAAVRVVEFIDANGETQFRTAVEGGVNLSTFLGLMELAKLVTIDHFNEGHE